MVDIFGEIVSTLVEAIENLEGDGKPVFYKVEKGTPRRIVAREGPVATVDLVDSPMLKEGLHGRQFILKIIAGVTIVVKGTTAVSVAECYRLSSVIFELILDDPTLSGRVDKTTIERIRWGEMPQFAKGRDRPYLNYAGQFTLTLSKTFSIVSPKA